MASRIADILAFEDRGDYLYVAGDCARAYRPKKLERFVRQIVFLRPGTFVVFDRVAATEARFEKTWLLQAMQSPRRQDPFLVITNGKGRLFVQTVLPRRPRVRLAEGADIYTYGGASYPPQRDTGPAPACRIEISPTEANREDLFLHVLTATDAAVSDVPAAEARVEAGSVTVTIGETTLAFFADTPGGYLAAGGTKRSLAAPRRETR